MRINTDISLCTNCRACLLACSMQNFGIFNPRLAHLKVEESEKVFTDIYTCTQCKNPVCARVCPQDAIVPGEKLVTVDKDKCTGCGICEKYCQSGMIKVLLGKACKCELCEGQPACVNACTTGAISYCGGDKR